jgi:hypothetical protein
MDGTNNSTSFTDSSVNGYTVNAVNGAKLSTSRSVTGGSAAEFSGSGASHLSLSGGSSSVPLPTGNDPYTVEAWINPRSYSNGVNQAQGIVGWGNWGATNQTNALRLDGDGRVFNYWWNNRLASEPVVPLNTWTHVAASFDGTTRRIFVNGVLVASDTPTGHNVTRVDNLRVGFTDNGVYDGFDGYIDDVRVTSGARYTANFTPPGSIA